MARKKKAPKDFVKFLQAQLKAFRARRFEQLDLEITGDELEGIVGQYRREVGEHAQGVIEILMRREYIYGDWSPFKGAWFMLQDALKESPSLAKTAASQMMRAYCIARNTAELHGEAWWPKRCPWRTLDALDGAVKARDREYRALEQKAPPDFVALRPIPIPERLQSWSTRARRRVTRGGGPGGRKREQVRMR